MSSSLLACVNAHADAHGGGQGVFEMPIQGVHILRAFQNVDANHQLYRPSLCIVLQGGKEILFGDDRLEYGTMQCLIVNVELPACGRIVEASAGEPFVGITIEFDVAAMREVLEQMETRPDPTGHSQQNLFVLDIDAPLAECVQRLIRMAQTPKAVPILYPAVMREIYYWLLSGPHGGEISKIALPDSHMDRIARAIRVLRENYMGTLRIEQLAEVAGMSPSSFHQHFKSLTTMTPLQFQKQLRLLEARRLMVADAVAVTQAAYQVGYESASQFSREYSRAFGTAPKRDVMNQQRLYAAMTSRDMPAL